ncbi:MAG: glycosyltransferase family 2 protein [Acidimicrobiia bacterium]|nr:glycosyltransferase family 2 protein [Acidimicrobiia bacterium]
MTGQSGVRVSVVVPVRNRRALLRQLLDALAAQTYRDFEVVVVDDGSTDGAPEEVADDAAAGRNVRLVANAGSGAVEGRCTGVALSKAEYLAFTDSDCVPHPGWLAAGVAALDDGADVVNGATRPARTVALHERSLASGEEGLYPTCNVFYRRRAYDEAGGFDVEAAARLGFRPWARARGLGFGEDTILAWRVRRAGRAAYVPEAVVEHAVFPIDVSDMVSRTVQMAAFPALVREVPELRDMPLFRHRYVLGNWSRAPLYAAAAAAGTRHRRAALASLGAWAFVQARRSRSVPVAPAPATVAAGFALRFALDTVAAGALFVGSVRSRTLVL